MADSDIDNLETVPTFAEALKLPSKDYYKYANAIFKYRNNCRTGFVETFDKFYEWCSAMNCLESLDTCHIPPHSETSTVRSVSTTLLSASSQWSLTTKSYIDMINAVGHNGTCYDDYYCTQQYFAMYLHYLIGIICLVLCLIGILTNMMFLPAFNVVSNRTGSTLYLTLMAIFDCLYMKLFVAIVVIRCMPYEYIHQVEMYARFSAYLIPHGLPTMELMELLSVWITVALLLDRFLYLKFGFHSRTICSRKLSVKIAATLFILLTAYTIPKYLRYKLISYPKIGIMKVTYTNVGISESFQNLLLQWLKVPVEMFLPYLAVAIFSVINSVKLYHMLFKRKLSEASKDRDLKKNSFNDAELTTKSDLDYMCLVDRYQSNATDFRMPNFVTSLKEMQDKENAIVIVSLILGFSLVIFKFPKFVLHALKSERYVELNSTNFFQPITDFLDLFWVVLKPLMFSFAKHFRGGVSAVFSCRDIGSEAIIGVQRASKHNMSTNSHMLCLRVPCDMKIQENSRSSEFSSDDLQMNLLAHDKLMATSK